MKWVLCGWLGSITIAFKVVGVFVLCFGLLVFFLLLVFVSRLPSTRWMTDCTGPDGVAPITSQEVTLRPGLCWGDGVGSGRGWGGACVPVQCLVLCYSAFFTGSTRESQPRAVCFGLSDQYGIYLQTPSFRDFQSTQVGAFPLLERGSPQSHGSWVCTLLTPHPPLRDILFQVSAGSLSSPPWVGLRVTYSHFFLSADKCLTTLGLQGRECESQGS